jgi:hypothetical protein
MQVRIALPAEIDELSKRSVSLGNIPLVIGQCIAAVLEHEDKIVGFAGVQHALHAAGSWIDEKWRGKKLSYEMRQALDNELRLRGYGVYFAIPGSDFEKHLFAKYGPVTEHLVQVRHL